jgi:hypothetical protein
MSQQPILNTSGHCNEIFDRCIGNYHQTDDVDTPVPDPFEPGSFDSLLYRKNWIDTVQWHLEDIVRNPDIDPLVGMGLKRRIDRSNQERTDLVEYIDGYFFEQFKSIEPQANARVNTESPAWAIDRLSILALKIFHMREEALRADAGEAHQAACQKKLAVLLDQRVDLSRSINELLADIAAGIKYMKVYKQMKMYNDPATNPILYQRQPNAS